jgi:hypothetical protein
MRGMSSLTDKKFDIVYSQGTLIMLSRPDLGLLNIIKYASKYLILNHTAIAKDELFEFDENLKYATAMYIEKNTNNTYIFTVFKESYFRNIMKNNGFNIKLMKKRKGGINHIAQFGRYELYDIVVER